MYVCIREDPLADYQVFDVDGEGLKQGRFMNLFFIQPCCFLGFAGAFYKPFFAASGGSHRAVHIEVFPNSLW